MQHDVALLMHLRSFKVLQVEPFIAFFYRNLCKLHIQFEIPTDSSFFFLRNHDMERTCLGTHYTLDTLIKDH